MPKFGELLSGPGAGEVTVMIKTVASGVEDPSQVFWFVITDTQTLMKERPYQILSQTIKVVLLQYDNREWIRARREIQIQCHSSKHVWSFSGGYIKLHHSWNWYIHKFNAYITTLYYSTNVCLCIGYSSNTSSILVGGVVGGLSVVIVLTLLTILLTVVVLKVLRRRGKNERQ